MKRSPILTLFITIFIDLLGFGIVIPMLPVISKDLAARTGYGLDPDIAVGIVAAGFSLMQFVFSPLWGTISDHRGRRPIILGSILATGFGYLLLGFSNTLLMLFLARIISGIGSANISAAQAYIADITSPEDRAKRMGLIGAAFGLGFVFGPPIGGLLFDFGQHHIIRGLETVLNGEKLYREGGVMLVGIFTAILCLVNFVLAWFTLPESLTERNADHRRSFKSAFDGLTTIWRVEVVGELFVISFIYIAAFSMMQTNASLMWSEHFNVSSKQNGWLFGLIGIMSAIVQGFLIGKFQAKIGLRKMLLYGTPLMALGLLIMPLPSIALFYYITTLSIILLVIGNGFLMPAINSLVSINTAPQNQGKVLGLMQSVGSLARGIGPLLAGFLYSFHFTTPYIVAAFIMLIAFYFALKLSKQIPREDVQAPAVAEQ